MNRPRVFLDSFFRPGLIVLISLLVLVLFSISSVKAQAYWSAVGPAGGDARAFAAVPGQPHHLYLGTTNSWLYESLDGGLSWHRLSKLDSSDDLILDHIVVDEANPATIYVATWRVDQADGGLRLSRDGGRNWSVVAGLHGQSIRAFAQAPSAPEILYAGTLEGVFRSSDSGASWTLISPPGSQEIHEVESLAIDPLDPNVVYAGTWHLPWKTTDGGQNWQSIKEGIVDDSDVFSIIIDPASPSMVFASACSGIYKSVDAGGLFHAVEGIPSAARRTRVLKQDPLNFNVVYAGTTEGLYKSVDGGNSFALMTEADVIVNDVFVDPQDTNHVLLATDRGGVLLSEDAASSFTAANQGFSGRKVEALLVDSGNPARLYAGVVNDKKYGGVYVSGNVGERWEQIADGLDGRDVFALAESPEGTILAGTNHGIFVLESDATGAVWSPRGTIQNRLAKTATETILAAKTLQLANIHKAAKARHGKSVPEEKPVADPVLGQLDRVQALDLSGDVWLASTGGGLFTSKDQGASWQGGPVMGWVDYLSVAVHGSLQAAARQEDVVLSTDAGQGWRFMGVPATLTRIHSVAFSADGTIWLGAREGVYFSRDLGSTWMWVNRFPLGDVDDLSYDAHLGKIIVSSRASDQIYVIDTQTLEWKWAQTGYRIAHVRTVGGRLLAASLFDGVLVEPQSAGVEAGQR
jgi:photosystem II stability/assembly factor-like uncharacterized protein